MKILAFTDHHASDKKFKKIKEKAKKADIIVCCGDFTWFSKDIEKQLIKFNKLGKPVLVVPGNHEDYELQAPEPIALDEMCEELQNVFNADNNIIDLGEALVLGYGGGGFSQEDERIVKYAEECKKHIKKGRKIILITHAPPYRTKLDKLPLFGHVGNKSINKAIKILKPKLLLCGHLHENFKKKDQLGTTIMLNPGPEGTFYNLK